MAWPPEIKQELADLVQRLDFYKESVDQGADLLDVTTELVKDVEFLKGLVTEHLGKREQVVISCILELVRDLRERVRSRQKGGP